MPTKLQKFNSSEALLFVTLFSTWTKVINAALSFSRKNSCIAYFENTIKKIISEALPWHDLILKEPR